MGQLYYWIISMAAGAVAAAIIGCIFGIIRSKKARGDERGVMIAGTVELILGAVYPAYVFIMFFKKRSYFLETTKPWVAADSTSAHLVTSVCVVLVALFIVCLCSIRKKGAARNLFCLFLAVFSILVPMPSVLFTRYFGGWSMIKDLPQLFLANALGNDRSWAIGRFLIMFWIISLAAAGIAFIVLGIKALVKRLTENRDKPLRIVSMIVSLTLLPITIYSSFCWMRMIAGHNIHPPVQDKPVLYFFTETETDVCLKLGYPETLTVTYPDYPEADGWRFTASPDGTLTIDGKQYPYMYFEAVCGNSVPQPAFSDKGFVVAGDDTASFLEDALGAMGFDYRQRADFITYWLPLMADNSFNRIEFLFGDDVNAFMPVSVTPQPDNSLQVYMLFAPCDPEIAEELTPQEFPVFDREGFAMLEWGGIRLG